MPPALECFAYRGSLVSESDRWLWRLQETEGALFVPGRVGGYGCPSWIIAKAKIVIPLLLADFEAYTSYNSSDNFKLFGDLPDFDDEEMVEIRVWDQNCLSD